MKFFSLTAQLVFESTTLVKSMYVIGIIIEFKFLIVISPFAHLWSLWSYRNGELVFPRDVAFDSSQNAYVAA